LYREELELPERYLPHIKEVNIDIIDLLIKIKETDKSNKKALNDLEYCLHEKMK
jgi:hypothetical protein